MQKPDSPFTSTDLWDRELRTAGFTGTDAMTSEPFGSVTIISSASHSSSHLGEIAIVTPADTRLVWAEAVSSEFERRGYAVQHKTLDNPPDQGRFVVCLLDAHTPYLEQLTEKEFTTFRNYLVEAEDIRLLWVTPPSTHLKCENPGFGIIHGLARTLRQEIGLDISVLEVDQSDSGATEAIVSVCEKINAARDRLDEDQDYEFALIDGTVHIPRSYRSAFSQDLTYMPAPDTPRSLTIGSTGHLDTVQWVPGSSATTPLGIGEVDVDVAYVGVNFRVGYRMIVELQKESR